MDPIKVGKFIKELRKKNNLTQNDLANKYSVTYQAVSKWENGLNFPDVSLLRQMSKDFNISIEDILSGELNEQKKNHFKFIIISVIVIVLIVIVLLFVFRKNNSFEFKTLSTTCEQFNVSGSIAYDEKKSSIYISHINYCGGDDETVYKKIECNLYENNKNTNTIISSCSSNSDTKLEEYLKDVELNIDNYAQTCSKYNDDSLYLEINATDDSGKTTSYKIPLNLNNNCPR